MNNEIFSLVLLIGAVFAGFFGALTGLGGGVVVIPILTLGFGIDMRYAVGTALVTSIATSSGAAAAYLKDGITNMRIGMFLEIATTLGAVIGALVAIFLNKVALAILFGLILIFSSIRTLTQKKKDVDYSLPGDKWGEKLKLNGTFPSENGEIKYKVHNVWGGYFLMFIAGGFSGILGIGSGSLKVLAMDTAMKIPFKVSTTTSNFMVGVTAAASAVIYLQRGYIAPGLAFPIIIGVLFGAYLGSKLLPKMPTDQLKKIFAYVIFVLALVMMYNGVSGKL